MSRSCQALRFHFRFSCKRHTRNLFNSHVKSTTYCDCFAWIDRLFKPPDRYKIVKTLVVALLKSIWIHRNDIIFNDKRVENEYVLKRMQELSYIWISNRSRIKIPDLNTWMLNPFCKAELYLFSQFFHGFLMEFCLFVAEKKKIKYGQKQKWEKKPQLMVE